MSNCQVEGCDDVVNKEGYKFCMKHWRIQNKGTTLRMKDVEYTSITDIAKKFGTTPRKMNKYLHELGWIQKPVHGKGWTTTKQGNIK